jgi:hypothetical protein
MRRELLTLSTHTDENLNQKVVRAFCLSGSPGAMFIISAIMEADESHSDYLIRRSIGITNRAPSS